MLIFEVLLAMKLQLKSKNNGKLQQTIRQIY